MERYSERLVNGRVGADAFLMIGGGVILALGGVVMIIVLSSFGLFFIAGGIFIIVQATKRFRIEFEYLILNGVKENGWGYAGLKFKSADPYSSTTLNGRWSPDSVRESGHNYYN